MSKFTHKMTPTTPIVQADQAGSSKSCIAAISDMEIGMICHDAARVDYGMGKTGDISFREDDESSRDYRRTCWSPSGKRVLALFFHFESQLLAKIRPSSVSNT